MNKLSSQQGSVVAIVAIFGVVIIGVLGFIFWNNTQSNQTTYTDNSQTDDAPAKKIAYDQTLGSGFAVMYPEGWTNVHKGATNPQSTDTQETDSNSITSPSGDIEVSLHVSTNTQIGGICSNDFLKLKSLSTDTAPDFSDGRYATYVMYSMPSNIYQYYTGLQKNTEDIRSVTVESNSACKFVYSNIFRKDSLLPGVPQLSMTLRIKFKDLHDGSILKPELDTVAIANKFSGTEYEQAKAIVQSIYVKE